MTELTRRAILVGAAASTAAAAIASITASPAFASETPTADPMPSFVSLSAALTGIDAKILAPESDTTKLKLAYFGRAHNVQPAFNRLLDFYSQNRNSDTADAEQKDVIKRILGTPEFCYLARSIILAWYLGTWHDPGSLQDPPLNDAQPPQVISPTAYTQGWIWRVAQTHPMGYSNLEFGYWSDKPKDTFDPKEFMIKEHQ